MKRYILIYLVIMITACVGQRNRVVFFPDPEQDQTELPDPFESWEIIESINGQGREGIPEWVRRYYNDKYNGIESLDQYSDVYVFAGENRGNSFNALTQWANGFAVEQDFPRLVAARVERRLISPASLYPDDEYGQFFERLIRDVSDGDYPGAVKGELFWLKRKVVIIDEENSIDDEDPQEIIIERYEFLIPITIDREILQQQLREIMSNIRTAAAPTREQASRINRVRQYFFEGF